MGCPDFNGPNGTRISETALPGCPYPIASSSKTQLEPPLKPQWSLEPFECYIMSDDIVSSGSVMVPPLAWQSGASLVLV